MRLLHDTARAAGVAVATTLLVVGGVANAANANVTIAATCPPYAAVGDNWAEGYCLNGGQPIAYQEHVRCSNGRTYHGPIITSTNGTPHSRAYCGGVNNFLDSAWLTHT